MVTDGLFRARIFLPVLVWLMKRVFCIELCGFAALVRDFMESLREGRGEISRALTISLSEHVEETIEKIV